MNPQEFKQMTVAIRQAEKAVGTVRYGASEQEASSLAFRRSVFSVKDIKKGERLTEDNIRVIRPGYGLSPKYYEEILGQTVLKDIEKGTPVKMDMIGRSE